MVDARNAQLAADTMRFGGANQAELWLAFARRGLGRGAIGDERHGPDARASSPTPNPLPDFEAPGQGNATLTFAATDARRGADAASTRGSTSATTRRASRRSPTPTRRRTRRRRRVDEQPRRDGERSRPGTYEFVATAPGYGAVRFRRTFRAGAAQTITLRLAPNVASKSQGATASGDAAAPSCRARTTVLTAEQVRDRLIDDTEATNWQAAAVADAATSWSVDGRQVTVDLAGTRAAADHAARRSARSSGRCSTRSRART